MALLLDMPQLSQAMHEGVLRRWRKSEGEKVDPGDSLAEVEIDKATMDWELSVGGTLLKRLVEEGATVPVGAPVAILGAPGEDITGLMVEARERLSAPAKVERPRLRVSLGPGDALEPLSPMRKTIARRMGESKTTVPHFYLTTDVDMDEAMDFRDQLARAHGTKVSVNDLVLKASALALRKHPEANASFGDEALIRHARIDIGMAVAIDDGLVTPVIRDADKKTLGQLGDETRELVSRARARRLRPEEMSGSTFSVSSLGTYGVDHFAAIINPPEAAILAVGRVRKEPVVGKGGQIVAGQRMALTLSCDHRVIDGAAGARLLQSIVAALEKPLALSL